MADLAKCVFRMRKISSRQLELAGKRLHSVWRVWFPSPVCRQKFGFPPLFSILWVFRNWAPPLRRLSSFQSHLIFKANWPLNKRCEKSSSRLNRLIMILELLQIKGNTLKNYFWLYSRMNITFNIIFELLIRVPLDPEQFDSLLKILPCPSKFSIPTLPLKNPKFHYGLAGADKYQIFGPWVYQMRSTVITLVCFRPSLNIFQLL